MKSPLNLFPLNSYKYKIFALIILLLGSMLILFDSLGFEIVFIESQSHNHGSRLYYYLIILGLYGMAYSKEKVEDERVKDIRNKAIKLSFGSLLMLMFSFTIASGSSFHQEGEMLTLAQGLTIILISGLSIYHIYFHLSLYRDPDWAYGEESSDKRVMRNKLLGILFILTLTIVTLIYQAFRLHV